MEDSSDGLADVPERPLRANHPQGVPHPQPAHHPQGADLLPPVLHHRNDTQTRAPSHTFTAEHTLQQKQPNRPPHHQTHKDHPNVRSPRAFQEITLCPPAPSLGSLHSAAAAPSSVPAEPLSTATVAVWSSSGLDAGTSGYMLQSTDVAEHLMGRTVTPAQDSIIASSSARAPTTLAGLRQLSLELVRSNIAEGSDSIRSVRNLWGIMRPRKRIPGFSSIRSIGELWVLQWLAPILRPRNTGNFSCFC